MTGFSILLIGMVLLSVRRAHIRVEYSVSWLAAALVLLALSRWRALLDRIGGAMGIDDAPLALLVVTGALFLLVLVSAVDDDFQPKRFQHSARATSGDPRVPP